MCEQAYEKCQDPANVGNLNDFFLKCPNCKQEYQNSILGKMEEACVLFNMRKLQVGGETSGNEKMLLAIKVAELTKRLRNIHIVGKKDHDEGKQIVDELVRILEVLKQCDSLPLPMDAQTHEAIGDFYETGAFLDKENLKKAKMYYERARDKIMNWRGDYHLDRKGVEYKIKRVESKLTSSDIASNCQGSKVEALKLFKERYDYAVEVGSDADIITAGIKLASLLFGCSNTIEAERLLHKLIKISRRLHGTNHNQTQTCLSLLGSVKERCVIITKEGWYEALRYEDDGKKCVIQGPMEEPRVKSKEQTFTVPSALVRPYKGTPVMLHGLKKASFNGKIGDVREYCEVADRYEVHFEDKSLKPVRARHVNLKVLFDLPAPKESS